MSIRTPFLILLLCASAAAQNPFETFTISQQALAQGDTAGYGRYALRAYTMAPFDLWFAHNLARAYAMNGQKTKCIELLDDLAVLGFDFGVENDEGFRNVWKHSLLKGITARAKKGSVRTASTHAFVLPEKDLIPEGIAYDPRRNTFFLSSVYKRKVVSVLPDGTPQDLLPETADGLFSTLGLRVDAARNQLWVLSSLQASRTRVKDPANVGKGRVHQYDLATMKLVNTYAPSDSLSHLFNDLTIASNGDVYITDSDNGSIYKVDAANRTMSVWYDAKDMFYPNGITMSPDQRCLFVAHWQGISRIGLDDRVPVLLTAKQKTTMTGIDGLYFYDGALIAVQNSAGPQSRVMRFDLNPACDAVTKATVLESAHPDHRIPTTGVIVGDDLYYIANSQLQSFDAEGNILPPAMLHAPVVLKLPLAAPQP